MSFLRYPKYKPSDVEWLGDVPAHWSVKRLKLLARPITEKANVSIRPIALENIESCTGKLIETENEFEGDGVAFVAGDLLFGKLRPYLAKAWLANSGGEAVGDFHVLRPTRATEGRFLQYSMLDHVFIDLVDGSTFGSKMPRASWEFVGGIPMCSPPIEEQRVIAAFLERETAKIDALVAEQERLIELLKEKRQAVISHAVTKGLDPTAPMKPSGIEWLGDVPAHWAVSPVKRLARSGARNLVDGDWIESPYITTDGIRLLQTGNIGIGAFKEQGYRYISEETFGQLGCTEVFPGDVLVCRLDGPVGRACLAPDVGDRMVTSVDNAILRCGDHVVPEFVVALFNSGPWLAWLDALCRVGGGFRLRVSRSQLGDLRIPVPPQSEQQGISDFLDSELANWERLMQEAQSAIGLLQERRSALISAAVTGQIDIRNAVPVEVA